MITQYITSKQRLLLAVASRTLKVLSLLIIFSVGINTNNLFAQGVPANPNDPDQAPAPTITSQPSSLTACAGTTASFSVSATAGSSISYQWQKNGVNIGGETNSTLSLNAVTSADAGTYSVIVSSSGVPVTSSNASLVVTTPALSYPESLSTCASTYTLDAGTGYASVTWSASAGGSTLPSNPNDPDAPVLTPSQFLAASNGWYKVIAVPASGCTLVDSVYVTVNQGPTVITSQPSAQTLNSGGNASFSVSATGLGTLTYQWFKDGVAISGATNSTYSISGVTSSNAGNYSVEVTGTCGSATSNNASLTVTVVNPPVISSQPASASQCAGNNVSFSVTSSVSAGSMTYQWKKNGVNISGATASSLTLNNISPSDVANYTVDVTGLGGTTTSNAASLTVNPGASIVNQPLNQFRNAGQNVLFKVVAGAGVTAYSWKKNGTTLSNGGKVSGATSSELLISNISSADAADYSVALTFGACGTTTSSDANLAVLSSQPTSVVKCAGQEANFSVSVATGSSSVAYQWSKNGVAISGATSSSLSLSNVSGSDNGSYSVSINVGGTSVNSTNASLRVNAATVVTGQPVGATKFATQGYLFVASGNGSGSISYQWSKNGNAISGATSPSLNISNISAGSAGSYTLAVTGSCGTATSNAAALTVISALPTAQAVCAGSNATFSTTVSSPSTVAYQWKKNGTDISGQTNASLSLSDASAADNAVYSVAINVDGNTTTVGSASLLVNPKTVINTHPSSQTRPAGSGVTFTVNASGTGAISYQWYRDFSPIFGETGNKIDITNLSPAAEATYFVIARSTCGSATSNAANLTVTVPAPTITANPTAVLRQCAGSSATLSVTATGYGTLNYQWKKNNVNISGANNSSLSLSNISSADAGNYTVVVSNLGGSVTSAGTSVSIKAATTIVSQPVSSFRRAGQSVSFTVNATGADGGSFQWKKDSVNISGATSSVLSLTNVGADEAGDYSVDVTYGCGTVSSNTTSLAVLVMGPQNQTKCVGQSATFFAFGKVGTTEPVSGQWYKNNVIMPGKTSPELVLDSVSANDIGSYSVSITVGSTTLLTNAASLAISSITSQPVSSFKRAGQSATFNVSTSTPATYQWKKNGTNITGATTAVLQLPNVGYNLGANEAGDYSVDVSFGNCSVSSNTASLAVLMHGPQNQTKCVGQSAIFSFWVEGYDANQSYQWYKNNVIMPGRTFPNLFLDSVSANDIGSYSLSITMGSNTLLTNAASLSVGSITSQPVSSFKRAGQSATFNVSTSTPAFYQWKKDGVSIPGAITGSFTIPSVAGYDAGDYTVDVSFGNCSVSSSSASLGVLLSGPSNETKCAGENAQFNVYFGGGSEPVSAQWLKNNVIMPGKTEFELRLSNVSVSDIGNYSLRVTVGSNTLLTNAATLLVNTSATISSQPVSAVRFASQSVSFSSIVTGNINGLTYQWTKDGLPISNSTSVFGATTSTLSLTSTTSASAGSYVLEVTGNCGTISTNAAALGIISTFKLADQSMCAGNNATFNVSATGPGLTYQWKKNGSDISGANSASYTMTGVSTSDAASYSVAIGNGGSSLTTGSGLLVVRALPSITVQPTNRNVAVGGDVAFAISANNATAFRWFRVNRTTLENPVAPVGGTVFGSNTFKLAMTSVKSPFNNYRYICRVTGACGTIVSDTVRLTVGGIAKNEIATISENTEMNLFPVPAQNVINLVTNGVEEGTYSIRILDQTGKLVMDRNTSGSEVNAGLAIEISDMSTGAYFLELKNANGEVMSMSKFIKIGN